MNELLEALERATNVESLHYHVATQNWIVAYKNGLPADVVDSDSLIDFLNNA